MKGSLNSAAHEVLPENDRHILLLGVFIIEACFGNYINFFPTQRLSCFIFFYPTFELLKILSTNYSLPPRSLRKDGLSSSGLCLSFVIYIL